MNTVLLYLAWFRLRFVVWRITRKSDRQNTLMFSYHRSVDNVSHDLSAWYGSGIDLREGTLELISAIDRCVRIAARAKWVDASPEALRNNNWRIDGAIYRSPFRVEIGMTVRKRNWRASCVSRSYSIHL